MAGLRLYVANVAYTPTPSTLSLLEKQLLGIDSQGFVRHSRAFNDPASQALILHAREEGNRIEWLPEYSFLLPAFVDTHLHAAQYLYAGTGYGSPLMEWLPRVGFIPPSAVPHQLALPSPKLRIPLLGALSMPLKQKHDLTRTKRLLRGYTHAYVTVS